MLLQTRKPVSEPGVNKRFSISCYGGRLTGSSPDPMAEGGAAYGLESNSQLGL
jgi:hypothetical protein